MGHEKLTVASGPIWLSSSSVGRNNRYLDQIQIRWRGTGTHVLVVSKLRFLSLSLHDPPNLDDVGP